MKFFIKKTIRKLYIHNFSQTIEDLKQNISELNEKLQNRLNLIDQLNSEIEQLKKQPQVCSNFLHKIIFVFLLSLVNERDIRNTTTTQ